MNQRNFSFLVAGSMLVAAAVMAGGKYSGGAGDGYAAAASAPTGLGGTPVTLALAADQIIERTWQSVPCCTVTLTDGSPAAVTPAGDLRLTIPDTLIQTWDTTVTAPLLGGAAAGRVAATVSYAAGGKTLVIDVTDAFGAGESLVINGLAFTNLVDVCLPERLSVDIHGDGIADAFSDKIAGVTVSRPGGLGDGGASFTMTADVPLVVPGETLILVR